VVELDTRPSGADLRPTYRDLRDWIEGVEALGQLRRVDGANTEEEIGLAQEVLTKHDTAPAVLFDKIPGYEPGYRVLSCPLGTIQRIAYTLGLPPDAPKAQLVDMWRKRFKDIKPIDPVEVTEAPILENVLMG
jgi:3-polyprenyl-4-hydroxybenzoate decarboxylase